MPGYLGQVQLQDSNKDIFSEEATDPSKVAQLSIAEQGPRVIYSEP